MSLNFKLMIVFATKYVVKLKTFFLASQNETCEAITNLGAASEASFNLLRSILLVNLFKLHFPVAAGDVG